MRRTVGIVALLMLFSMVATVSAHTDFKHRDYYQWADRQYNDYDDWYEYHHDRDHDRYHDRDRKVIYRAVYYDNRPRTVHVYNHYRPVVVHDRYPYHYRNSYRYYW